jgi:hypothetical protein
MRPAEASILGIEQLPDSGWRDGDCSKGSADEAETRESWTGCQSRSKRHENHLFETAARVDMSKLRGSGDEIFAETCRWKIFDPRNREGPIDTSRRTAPTIPWKF